MHGFHLEVPADAFGTLAPVLAGPWAVQETQEQGLYAGATCS